MMAFILGIRTGEDYLDPGVGQDGIEKIGELPVPVPD
jgi:hypothetical protein